MSLKLYFDAAGTQPVLTAEKFTGAGPYTLSAFTGAKLGGIYKEIKNTYSNVSFSAGVGTAPGLTGLGAGSLKGQRVIHNNKFVGQIADNTDTNFTLSTTYTATAGECTLSKYSKLYTPTDFTLSGNSIAMITPTLAGEIIHAIPTDTLAMYFGGAVGAQVTKNTTIYVKRDTTFEYTLLQVSSDDVSLFPYHTSTAGVVFTGGGATSVGSNFAGLPVNGLVGKALNHAGVYRGIITANTATTVTITGNYSGIADTAEIYNVGSLQFSVDGTNYAPVVNLADLTGANVTATVHVRDTLSIPSVAINYPANIVKVSGIEFIA
jgi:hypothetical protein